LPRANSFPEDALYTPQSRKEVFFGPQVEAGSKERAEMVGTGGVKIGEIGGIGFVAKEVNFTQRSTRCPNSRLENSDSLGCCSWDRMIVEPVAVEVGI